MIMIGSLLIRCYFVGVLTCLHGSVMSQQGAPAQERICSMTPPNIEEDFLSNCGGKSIAMGVCNMAWDAFRDAFSGRNASTVIGSDYDSYFNLIPIQAMQNQSLFWSGTLSLVEIVSMMMNMGVNVVSSANVLSSEIINNIPKVGDSLSWCGVVNGGIDYINNCLCIVTTQFWSQFSARFAQAARGTVFFMGDGQREGGAFSPRSFFATVELVNMGTAVTRVVALIVHPEGVGDSCNDTNSSLTDLRSRVEERNFMFDCYDIHGDISQTETIAGCAVGVINDVQQGSETEMRAITCSASMLQVSVVLVLLLFLAIRYII